MNYFLVLTLLCNSFATTQRTKLTLVYLDILISISIEWSELMWAWSQIHCNFVCFFDFASRKVTRKKGRLMFWVYPHHTSGAGVRALLTRLRTSFVILFVSLESSPTSVWKGQVEKSIKFILHTIAQVWNVRQIAMQHGENCKERTNEDTTLTISSHLMQSSWLFAVFLPHRLSYSPLMWR